MVDRAGIVSEVWRSGNDPSRVIRSRRWCRLRSLGLRPFVQGTRRHCCCRICTLGYLANVAVSVRVVDVSAKRG